MNALADIIATVTQGRVEAASIAPETVLVDGGVALDSLEILELVVVIEERLGVELDTADLTPANLGTFARLTALVDARVAAGSTAPPP